MLQGIFKGSAWKKHSVFKVINTLHSQFKRADNKPLNPYQVKMMHALNGKAIEDGNGRPDRAYIIRNGTIQQVPVLKRGSVEAGPNPLIK